MREEMSKERWHRWTEKDCSEWQSSWDSGVKATVVQLDSCDTGEEWFAYEITCDHWLHGRYISSDAVVGLEEALYQAEILGFWLDAAFTSHPKNERPLEENFLWPGG